jgi:hypothetical protein
VPSFRQKDTFTTLVFPPIKICGHTDVARYAEPKADDLESSCLAGYSFHPVELTTQSPGSLGGIAMQGERCGEYLLFRVAAMKVAQAGGVCEEGDIARFFRDCATGQWQNLSRKISNTITAHGSIDETSGKTVLNLDLGNSWKVILKGESGVEGGTVSTAFKSKGSQGPALLQDPPGGEAAKITVTRAENPYLKGVGFAYVSREQHYSFGLLWDPSPGIPADQCYYEDGTVKDRRRYQAGKMGGDDHSPCYQGYWPDGQLKIEEYGKADIGKFRNPEIGPSYSEFYPGGQRALEICSQKTVDGGVVVTGGGAWDEDGNKTLVDPQVARFMSDTSLSAAQHDTFDGVFADRRVRGWVLIDTGSEEEVEDEQKRRSGGGRRGNPPISSDERVISPADSRGAPRATEDNKPLGRGSGKTAGGRGLRRGTTQDRI